MASNSDLINAVADICDVSKAAAQGAVDAVFVAITDSLKQGDDVRLTGFGSFSVTRRAARAGRNPRTGETIQIRASNQAKFKAGEALKKAVNNR